MVKVTSVSDDDLKFEDGTSLWSDHDQDCCEHHYLDFSGLTQEDFEGLDFNLSSDSFFERVEGFGIRLVPINGHPISVPGYGSNNGYYSHNLTLVLSKDGQQYAGLGDKLYKTFDISNCQVISD